MIRCFFDPFQIAGRPLLAATLLLSVCAVQLIAAPAKSDEFGGVIVDADLKKLDHATLQKMAEAGNSDAQMELARRYALGDRASVDPALSAKWLRKAAEQGLAEAQNNLAGCYIAGEGVERSPGEGLKWMRKAAEQGLRVAQWSLGNFFFNGIVEAKDQKEAAKWYRKSADQGFAQAQFDLGSCYYHGEGIGKDLGEARKWFLKAAQQGNSYAQHNVACFYLNGEGVARDYEQALVWYLKAAEQGLADSQYNAGSCYAEGKGVIVDYIQAYKWFNLASAQGHELARKSLARYEKQMTPVQIAEAQKLCRNFQPQIASQTSAETAGFKKSPVGIGTGFVITTDGFLVTNAHVIKDGRRFEVMTRNGLVAASLVRKDVANDVALLKVSGSFRPLPLKTSSGIRIGCTVATVGFPNVGLQGFLPKLSKGEIASIAGANDDPRYFQISIPVQPGNSGGALFDERGNVVGVVSAKLDAAATLKATGELPENVNYAIKSSFLLGFLESFPEVVASLPKPSEGDIQFEDAAAIVQEATALVVVY